MKKNSIIGVLIFIFFVFQSSLNKSNYHRFPPTNCTGAPNGYTCGFCHSDFAENMAGGGISIAGIPTTFVKGNTYPFSINIHHFTKDRKKFGYDIVALDALGNKVGSFGTSNPYSILGDSEITSNNPPILSDTDRTTIGGFYWTAPDSTFTPNRLPITFYFCGNACNYDGKANGDFVYNDSLSTTIGILPIEIERFVATRKSSNEVQLSWYCGNASALKRYVIQKSNGGSLFFDLDSVCIKSGVTASNKYIYIDQQKENMISVSYRIKSVAKDGTVCFSKVSAVGSITNGTVFKIYPNPIHRNNSLNFVFASSQNKVCTINIVSKTGVLLLSKKQTVVVGSNKIEISIGQTFAGGTYILTLGTDNSILYQQKFIVE